MTQSKHTEGPWSVERDDHFGPGFVIVSPAAGMHNRSPVVRLQSPLMELDKTLEADAYLIAAAPDLLAFAEEVKRRCVDAGLPGHELVALADAAIAKATS